MPRKSKKSEKELESDMKEKVVHAVERIDDWSEKITRYAKSKRFNLTDTQKAKIVEHLAENIESVNASFLKPKGEKKTTFKLD